MMQEDKYPGYQVIFRQLSKEEVKFPARDPNMRMYMEQFCKDSPMFDYVEQISGRPVLKNDSNTQKESSVPEKVKRFYAEVPIK